MVDFRAPTAPRTLTEYRQACLHRLRAAYRTLQRRLGHQGARLAFERAHSRAMVRQIAHMAYVRRLWAEDITVPAGRTSLARRTDMKPLAVLALVCDLGPSPIGSLAAWLGARCIGLTGCLAELQHEGLVVALVDADTGERLYARTDWPWPHATSALDLLDGVALAPPRFAADRPYCSAALIQHLSDHAAHPAVGGVR